MSQPFTINKYFRKLKDPRINRRKKHLLIDIVTITICAVICGCNDWQQIETSMRRCGFGRVLEAHVYMASRLLKWPGPSTITPTWRAALHYRRCLAFNFIRGATTLDQRVSLKNFISKATMGAWKIGDNRSLR